MRQLAFLVFIVSLLVGTELFSQPPEGFRRGRRPPGSGPPRGRLQTPEAVIGVPDPARPPAADTTLGIGTVPALWEIKPSQWGDDFPDLSERDTIAPPVPAKVVRYAVYLLGHYDTNGDGVWQREEWANLPGAPQAIDIDGDGIITLDELVRHLAVYGAKRTIHRPNPVETFYQPRVVSSQFQLFKPLSAPTAAPVPDGTITVAPTEDMTAERLDTDMGEGFHEDTTYEDIVAGALPSTEKKYYTTPEALRGVPRWFPALDRNGDGQVSLAEFAPNMSPASLALFGRLDKNGDGFITPDEVRKEEPPQKEELPPVEPTPSPEPTPPAEPMPSTEPTPPAENPTPVPTPAPE